MATRIASPARIVDLGKAAHQGHRRGRFHVRRPKDESRRHLFAVHKMPLQVLEDERISCCRDALAVSGAAYVN
jgi:hypothetical protein